MQDEIDMDLLFLLSAIYRLFRLHDTRRKLVLFYFIFLIIQSTEVIFLSIKLRLKDPYLN